ncbi:MAG: PP2C family protein-serine/threonine phosphatase [Cyanobium sp.]
MTIALLRHRSAAIAAQLRTLTSSLRFRLVVSVWLAMLITFCLGNLFLMWLLTPRLVRLVEEERREAALYLVSNLQTWEDSIQRTMNTLSKNSDVRSLDRQRAASILETIHQLTPSRHWRLWRADGTLLFYSGKITNKRLLEKRITSDAGFLKALRGQPSYGTGSILNDGVLDGCLLASQSIYSLTSKGEQAGDRVDGVLSFCLPFSAIGSDSGLTRLETNRKKSGFSAQDSNLLEIQKGVRKGSILLLISNQGNLVFPDLSSDRLAHVSRLSPMRLRNSPWSSFIRQANDPATLGKVRKVNVDSTTYFVLANQVSDRWTTMLVVDQETLYEPIAQTMKALLLLQLASLLVTALAIYIACRTWVRPVQEAAGAIKQISHGEFDVSLTGDHPGELGELFHSINNTGGRLKQLIQSQLDHALTDKQIDTAMKIQQSFLISNLPLSESFHLFAFCDPAYDIGADWYDATTLDGVAYLVVADVCDKGVASALFMSVFRSLLRYQLLYHSAAEGLEQHMQDVMTRVNDYMAVTHADAAMFATIFLGAYRPETRLLSYISAGHEPAIILKADHTTLLLEGVNGPAVGVFPGSTFSHSQIQLEPGDVVVLYSDGFPDARSPDDRRWTTEQLLRSLESLPQGLNVQEICQSIRLAANQHIKDASQFDDMTLMVLEVN